MDSKARRSAVHLPELDRTAVAKAEEHEKHAEVRFRWHRLLAMSFLGILDSAEAARSIADKLH